jgi:hypothetical protein
VKASASCQTMPFSPQAALAPKFSASATGEVTDYPGELRCSGDKAEVAVVVDCRRLNGRSRFMIHPLTSGMSGSSLPARTSAGCQTRGRNACTLPGIARRAGAYG